MEIHGTGYTTIQDKLKQFKPLNYTKTKSIIVRTEPNYDKKSINQIEPKYVEAHHTKSQGTTDKQLMKIFTVKTKSPIMENSELQF